MVVPPAIKVGRSGPVEKGQLGYQLYTILAAPTHRTRTSMPRQTTAFALTLPPREPGSTAARWLYSALRAAILDGRLGPGTRLPATRDVARHYRLSRGTIVAAFEQLKSEGYVEARVGSGTRVAAVLPDRLLEAGRRRHPRPAEGGAGPSGCPSTAGGSTIPAAPIPRASARSGPTSRRSTSFPLRSGRRY